MALRDGILTLLIFDYYNNRVDVRGHKYVFGPTQNHFNVNQFKMSSEKGQKHIYAQEHQLYYYYNNFKALLTFNFSFVFKKTTTLKWLPTIYTLAIASAVILPAKYFTMLAKVIIISILLNFDEN